MAVSPFVRGAHGEIIHPDDVAALRQRASEALQPDLSPVGHWTQGLARLVNAWGGYRGMQRADREDAEGRARADALRQSLMGGLSSGSFGTGGSSSGAVAALGGSGTPVSLTGTPQAQPETGAGLDAPNYTGDWLRYTNQNATRNLPISDELAQALSFLPEMGVTMEVFSGGQPSSGSGRVGSHRHDDGNAADVRFYQNGRPLDWSNPSDVPLFQEIVRQAQARGVTGFGAGEGYMQPGTMHIGFGAPAVWGAGGRGANAADWLREAYSGGGASYTPPDFNANTSALMEAMGDPYFMQQYGPVAQALMGQNIAQQNAWTQEQMRRADPSYQMGLQNDAISLQMAQLELEQALNPQTPEYTDTVVNGQVVRTHADGTVEAVGDFRTQDPFTLSPGQVRYNPDGSVAAAAPAAPTTLSPGQSAVDLSTGAVVAALDPNPTAMQQNIESMGLPAGTPDYNAVMGEALVRPSSAVNVNMGESNIDPMWGTPDPGFVWARDKQGNVATEIGPDGFLRPIQVPIAGGAADTERRATEQEAQAMSDSQQQNIQTQLATVNNAAQRIMDAASEQVVPSMLTGAVGAALPSSASAEIRRQVDVLRANAIVGNLQAMRRDSPTGGALGNVSDAENRMLAAKSGALDPNSQHILRDTGDYLLTQYRIVHGFDAGNALFDQAFPEGYGGITSASGTPEELAVYRDNQGGSAATVPSVTGATGDNAFSTMSVSDIDAALQTGTLTDEQRAQAVERLQQIISGG